MQKEVILDMLDVMASYKLNKFHFHLTDDEGWRLEIPSLPELTEVKTLHTHPQWWSRDFCDRRRLPLWLASPVKEILLFGHFFYKKLHKNEDNLAEREGGVPLYTIIRHLQPLGFTYGKNYNNTV